MRDRKPKSKCQKCQHICDLSYDCPNHNGNGAICEQNGCSQYTTRLNDKVAKNIVSVVLMGMAIGCGGSVYLVGMLCGSTVLMGVGILGVCVLMYFWGRKTLRVCKKEKDNP